MNGPRLSRRKSNPDEECVSSSPGSSVSACTSEAPTRLVLVNLLAGRRFQPRCNDPLGRPAPGIDAIEYAVDPIEKIPQLRVAQRRRFFSKLVTDDGTHFVHVKIAVVLREPVTKVIDYGGKVGCHRRGVRAPIGVISD